MEWLLSKHLSAECLTSRSFSEWIFGKSLLNHSGDDKEQPLSQCEAPSYLMSDSQSVSLSVCQSVWITRPDWAVVAGGLTGLQQSPAWSEAHPAPSHGTTASPLLSSPLHRLMMGSTRNWEYFCSRYLSFTTPFTSHCALQSADNNPGIELSLNRETPISAVHTCYITTPHSNQQRREKLKQWKLDIVFFSRSAICILITRDQRGLS